MGKKELPKEILMTLYLEEKKTCKEIAEFYGTAPNTVKARLLEHSIPVRSRAEAHALALEKFGSPKPKGTIPWNKGIPRTAEEKEKISARRKGMVGLRGEEHPRWNGGRSVGRGGYVLIWIAPDNHYISMAQESNRHGHYVLEHRLVMAQTLERSLDKDEIVHHLNGIRSDNRAENLVLVKRNTHEQGTLVKALKNEILKLQIVLRSKGWG